MTPPLAVHAEGFDALAGEWDALADRLGGSAFLRPGWFSAWWDAFGEGELRVLAARRSDRLVGVLPTWRRARSAGGLSNPHSPVFDALAEDAEATDALVEDLFAGGRGVVEMVFLDADGRAARSLQERAASHGYWISTRVLLRSPFLRLEGDWGSYEAGLGAKMVRELRRRSRRLAERGRVELDVRDGREGLDELLTEGFRLEGSGWKTEAGSAIASTAATRQFYRAVAGWAAARGALRLAFLRVGGEAIAFDYCLEEAGTHSLVKTGFATSARHLAPGLLLRQAMVRRAFDLGLERYELLGTDDPWKRAWARETRDRIAFRAFPRTPRGWLRFARERARRAAARVRHGRR